VATSPSDISGYLSLLWRRKWIILPFLILMPLAAYIRASGETPVYEASAEVLLNRQSQSLSGVDDLSIWQPERVIRTQSEIARLPAIGELVVDAAGIDRDAGTFMGQSGVDADEQSDLLTFRASDEDGALAVRLANLYAEKYIEYRRRLDTNAINEASRALTTQLAALRRQGVSPNATVYGDLVQRQQQLETARTLQESNALLVREAASAGQISPQPERTAMLALAVAIVLGLGLALLAEAVDTRLRSPQDIADELGLPLIGSLPEPPRQLRKTGRLVMLDAPNSADGELFRMLRTSVDVTALERGCGSIMITSPLQAEGKSTTAANLAVAFARSGRHVVLVDLDIRRPGLSNFFAVRRRPGMTDLVAGRATLEEAVVRVPFNNVVGVPALTPVDVGNGAMEGDGNDSGDDLALPDTRRLLFGNSMQRRLIGEGINVDADEPEGRFTPRQPIPSSFGALEVVGAGSIPDDPGDFVVGSRIDALLDELRRRADLLLVDGPPLLLAGDALTLSAKVDALLVLTRANTLRRGQISEVDRLLSASPALKIGLVVTGDTVARRRPYYGTPFAHDEPQRPLRT
jgi:Mrp family chromosome partitioning ATPase